MRNALEPLQVAAANIKVDVSAKKVTVRVPKAFDSQKIIDVLQERYPEIKEISTQGSGVRGQDEQNARTRPVQPSVGARSNRR